MLPSEAFLSHSSLDRAFVDQLAAVLRRHGVPVWYSRTNLLGAQQWHDQIGAALARCDWFLLVLSPNAVASMWVRRELVYALRQARLEDQIVPVLYRACDYDQLSWVLSNYQFVDFQKNFDEGCRALLRLWGLGHQPVP